MKFKKGDKIRWYKTRQGVGIQFTILETPDEIGTKLYRIYDPIKDVAIYQNSDEVDFCFLLCEE